MTTIHGAGLVDVDHTLAQLLDTPTPAPQLAVVCDACGLHGEPIDANEAIAQDYAGTHDDLHHRGRPTADLRPCQPGPSTTDQQGVNR